VDGRPSYPKAREEKRDDGTCIEGVDDGLFSDGFNRFNTMR